MDGPPPDPRRRRCRRPAGPPRPDDAELDAFTGQLASILEHAEDVEALDIDDVPPTAHPYELVNVLRPTRCGHGVDRDEVLAQAPAAEDGRFRVPAILGEDP